jgi:hypothetical protein
VILKMQAATVTIKGLLMPIRWRFARLEGKGISQPISLQTRGSFCDTPAVT